MSKVFIVGGKRTPFGAFNKSLKKFSATELAALASKATLKDFNPEAKIDSIIIGNVLQTSSDAAYLARHVGLRCKISKKVPALTINRLCGSGFQAVINALHEIKVGDSNIVLAGGTESMSQAPHIIRGARSQIPYGTDIKAEDSLYHCLIDKYPAPTPMGITAENLAKKYNITRQNCDDYSLLTQKRWDKGNFV